MRQSDSVVNKIMDRLSVRLGEKIEEKNLQEWVVRIAELLASLQRRSSTNECFVCVCVLSD
jgi:hypothetical protein